MQDAKTHLSRLVARATEGEEIVIARDGKPLVRLVPVETPAKRELGFLHFEHPIPDSVWEPMTEEELADWE